MTTLKQFLYESNTRLYKRVNDKTAAGLKAGIAMPVKLKFTSFVNDPKHLKSEFGNNAIVCDVSSLPKGVKVIEIQYDLAWFTQSSLHRELLMMVTGKDEAEWLEEFDGNFEAADEEIETLFGDEHETVLVGLKDLDPKFFKVISKVEK